MSNPLHLRQSLFALQARMKVIELHTWQNVQCKAGRLVWNYDRSSSPIVQPARSATKLWTTVRLGRTRMQRFTKIAPVCPNLANVLSHAAWHSPTRPGEKCVLSGNMRLAASFPDTLDSGITKARRFIVEIVLELKSKQQQFVGQGSAALLAGGGLPPKGWALGSLHPRPGTLLSLLNVFWQKREPTTTGRRKFPICQGSIHEKCDFLRSCGFRSHGLTSFYLSACRLTLQRLPPMPRAFVARTTSPFRCVVWDREDPGVEVWRTTSPCFTVIHGSQQPDCVEKEEGPRQTGPSAIMNLVESGIMWDESGSLHRRFKGSRHDSEIWLIFAGHSWEGMLSHPIIGRLDGSCQSVVDGSAWPSFSRCLWGQVGIIARRFECMCFNAFLPWIRGGLFGGIFGQWDGSGTEAGRGVGMRKRDGSGTTGGRARGRRQRTPPKTWAGWAPPPRLRNLRKNCVPWALTGGDVLAGQEARECGDLFGPPWRMAEKNLGWIHVACPGHAQKKADIRTVLARRFWNSACGAFVEGIVAWFSVACVARTVGKGNLA